MNELISNLFGVTTDKIDEYKVKKQLSFVSKKDFETYKNKSDEEFTKIWEEINNLKKIFDDINNQSNKISTVKDLENMKDLILQKTEELFMNQNKKYSTNLATVEILQEQFKKLLELLAIKEEQEKENWLMAKKPINGFSCASCESFIGDLKNDKNRFIHWNKLPIREREMSGEKFFRVGNGYSRLLQMINFDSNGNVTAIRSGKVTITVEKGGEKGTLVFTVKPEMSFTDVTGSNWYYDSVKYVYDNHIMHGLNETTFAPNNNLSRSMTATILYNMAGKPDISGTSPFKDVKNANAWYYKAVLWAAENDIVNGYKNGNFGPNDNITREQLAIMLYNYANYRGKNVSKLANITSFTDYKKVASYATTAVEWVVGAGVITGSNNKLNPKGNATRAEAASMIFKYCENVGK